MATRVWWSVLLALGVAVGGTSCGPTSRIASAQDGPDTVFFRPVLCTLPMSAGVVTSPVAPPANLASACTAADSRDIPDTPRSGDVAAASVIDPNYTGSLRYVLGPADLTAGAIASDAQLRDPATGDYELELVFTGPGSAAFDRVARLRYPYYQQDPSNPPFTSLEAIEVDGVVVSAPTIQASSSSGTAIIVGSSAKPYTLEQIQQLAAAIDRAIH